MMGTFRGVLLLRRRTQIGITLGFHISYCVFVSSSRCGKWHLRLTQPDRPTGRDCYTPATPALHLSHCDMKISMTIISTSSLFPDSSACASGQPVIWQGSSSDGTHSVREPENCHDCIVRERLVLTSALQAMSGNQHLGLYIPVSTPPQVTYPLLSNKAMA